MSFRDTAVSDETTDAVLEALATVVERMVTIPATKTYPLAHVNYGAEEVAAVMGALTAGETTCGTRVKTFERRFAEYVGRKHAIMVNSGSSADLLVAFGLGPAKPGDEVLVPAVTWPTQVWSCVLAGYTVRLVDVDPDTLQFDLADMDRKLNEHTKALFPVHVLGNTGDLTDLTVLAVYYDLKVIEDCCEALGATWQGQHVGTFGQAAAYSFFFSHVITTMEGGMVVCNTADADRQYRLWRSHGWEPKQDYRFWFPTWGFNLRPTELQGAFGSVQITKIEQYIAARQRNYDRLVTSIHGDGYLTGVRVLPDCEPSWHGYPIMVAEDAPYTRDALCRHLETMGIETRPIIAGNLARQPAVIADSRIISGPLPGADQIHDQGFYIGLASFDDPDGTAYVAEVLEDFLKAQ